jgi:diguanylate cyclase (GGDEF)-like protein
MAARSDITGSARAKPVTVLVPSLYVMAGAIAYAMVYCFLVPVARQEKPVLHALAATYLFAALVAVFSASMLRASSDLRFLRALKSNIDCLILTALAFSVFVTRYAKLAGRAWRSAFAAYASICLALVALNELLPCGLQYERFDGIRPLRLPWNETVSRGAGPGGPLLYLTIVVVEGAVPYALIVLFRLYRRTRDRSVLWMLVSVASFVPFAVEGLLVRLSVIHGFPAAPLGMLIITVVTGATLAQETKRKLLDSEERMRRLAFFDRLTQLPNRELLQDRLNKALAASARTGRYGALLLLNLDDFKSVNDTLGDAAGDALLKRVAARLAADVGAADMLARVDRDEFVVLLEELAAQPLEAAAQARTFGLKMMSAVSGAYSLSEGSIHVSCSVGAAILAGHQHTSQDLLKQANIALHQAKKAGRNALRFFDPRMQESVSARAALEVELCNAIAASQFVLHYQLQVDESGRELGTEALLRWNHPERGLVSPAEFIGLAEETHLILAIGQWVIEAACARLAAWSRDARTRELSVAVNVSSLQFQQPEFALQVLGSIRRHGVNAGRLKLELTETMLQGDLERTVSTMNMLKAEGVRFCLDDFGTGYSSLQYLKQLPLDQLKIDRSFVRDIAADPNDRAIVTTIVGIAGHLGLDVIAEGVETPEQLRVLRECGCTRYQGYLFGRPVAAEHLFEAGPAPSCRRVVI